MNKFKLSIILYCDNRNKYVEATLNSLAQQTNKDFEILICDDFSEKDITGHQNYSSEIKNIRYSRNPEFIGIGPSLVKNIALSKGEYVTFMIPGDTFNSEFVADALKVLEKKQYPILISKYWLYDNNNQEFSDSEYYQFTDSVAEGPISVVPYNIKFLASSVCGVLFNKQKLIESQVDFYKDLFFPEFAFMWEMLLHYPETYFLKNSHVLHTHQSSIYESFGAEMQYIANTELSAFIHIYKLLEDNKILDLFLDAYVESFIDKLNNLINYRKDLPEVITIACKVMEMTNYPATYSQYSDLIRVYEGYLKGEVVLNDA